MCRRPPPRALRPSPQSHTFHPGDVQENKALVGEQIEVRGWVRTVRAQKTFAFLEVNDGSSLAGLQVVVADDADGHALVQDGQVTTGCSVAAFGELVESPGGKQAIELKASSLRLIGALGLPSAPGSQAPQSCGLSSTSLALHRIWNAERPSSQRSHSMPQHGRTTGNCMTAAHSTPLFEP